MKKKIPLGGMKVEFEEVLERVKRLGLPGLSLGEFYGGEPCPQ